MALPALIRRGRQADPGEFARDDFNMMLSQLFGGMLESREGRGPLASLQSYGVDIREDADHIYVEADLPGFRKEDVDIALENGTLTIIAERQEETPGEQQGQQGQQQGKQAKRSQQNEDYLLRERRIERFVRSFTLPHNVDEQNVQAKLENGVLSIVLNKREDAKPKRVPVS